MSNPNQPIPRSPKDRANSPSVSKSVPQASSKVGNLVKFYSTIESSRTLSESSVSVSVGSSVSRTGTTHDHEHDVHEPSVSAAERTAATQPVTTQQSATLQSPSTKPKPAPLRIKGSNNASSPNFGARSVPIHAPNKDIRSGANQTKAKIENLLKSVSQKDIEFPLKNKFGFQAPSTSSLDVAAPSSTTSSMMELSKINAESSPTYPSRFQFPPDSNAFSSTPDPAQGASKVFPLHYVTQPSQSLPPSPPPLRKGNLVYPIDAPDGNSRTDSSTIHKNPSKIGTISNERNVTRSRKNGVFVGPETFDELGVIKSRSMSCINPNPLHSRYSTDFEYKKDIEEYLNKSVGKLEDSFSADILATPAPIIERKKKISQTAKSLKDWGDRVESPERYDTAGTNPAAEAAKNSAGNLTDSLEDSFVSEKETAEDTVRKLSVLSATSNKSTVSLPPYSPRSPGSPRHSDRPPRSARPANLHARTPSPLLYQNGQILQTLQLAPLSGEEVHPLSSEYVIQPSSIPLVPANSEPVTQVVTPIRKSSPKDTTASERVAKTATPKPTPAAPPAPPIKSKISRSQSDRNFKLSNRNTLGHGQVEMRGIPLQTISQSQSELADAENSNPSSNSGTLRNSRISESDLDGLTMRDVGDVAVRRPEHLAKPAQSTRSSLSQPRKSFPQDENAARTSALLLRRQNSRSQTHLEKESAASNPPSGLAARNSSQQGESKANGLWDKFASLFSDDRRFE